MGRTIQLGSKRANKIRRIALGLFERYGRPVLLAELIAEVEANHNEVASADSVGALFRAGYFGDTVAANCAPVIQIKGKMCKIPVSSEDCNKIHHIGTTVLPKGYVMALGQTWPKDKLRPIDSDRMPMPEELARERSEAFERSLKNVKPQTWHAYASARSTQELERMFKYRSVWLRRLLAIGIIFDIVYAVVVFF